MLLQDFFIAHRRKPRVFAPEAHTQAPVWATCLRSLAFTPNPHGLDLHPEDEVYASHKAYQFLLEIVCGLHSPIVGETEVFGQFKNFAAQEWLKLHPERASLVQRLLSDAKTLRSQYLSNMGTQSYGSWLKRNLHARKVHVLGAGHLVKEVLPYLEKQAEVVVHARNPARVDFHRGPVCHIDQNAFDHGALIIAAPLEAQHIGRWLNAKAPSQVFDLRDSSSTDPLAVPPHVDRHGLHDIFNEIQQTKHRLQPVIEQVKKEIVMRSERLASFALVRPQGWDDLCA